MKKQIRIYIYIIGLILIDQLSKIWALSALRGTEGIVVIPNVFELSYLENRGAAFGILQDHQIFFVFGVKMNNIFPRDHSAAPLLEIRS